MTDNRDELMALAERVLARHAVVTDEERKMIHDALRSAASSAAVPVGYISPTTRKALHDPHGAGPIVAAAGYDTTIPLYATPVTTGVREAERAMLDACKNIVSCAHGIGPRIRAPIIEAMESLASAGADKSSDGTAGKADPRGDEPLGKDTSQQGAGVAPGPSEATPSVRGALEKAHGQFCLIAATNCWTHNNLQGWQESPGALREFAEEAAKEIDAALRAHGGGNE